MKEEIKVGGLYRHFKGTVYRVIGIAEHTDTGEITVVYVAMDPHKEQKLWNRPIEKFFDHIDRPQDGYVGPRFTEVL